MITHFHTNRFYFFSLACKCSDIKTVVPKNLSFANGTALVEWEIPYPICLNDDGRNGTNKTSKILHAGEHTINYTYDMTNGPFEHEFILVCSVNIFVPGMQRYYVISD